MIGFQFENHPTLPVAQDRLDAFNRYIEQKTRELLEIPVIDEPELEKAMELKLQTVRSETKVPLLIDSIKPLAKGSQVPHRHENSLAAKESEARQACKAIEKAAEIPNKNVDTLER